MAYKFFFFFFFASKFLSGRKSCSSLPLVVYELFWILLSQTSFELGQLLFIWGQSALRQKHKGNPLQISGTLSINSYLFLFLFFLLKCIASSKSHLHLLNFIRLQDSGCVSSACAIIWKIASGKYAGHFIGSTLFFYSQESHPNCSLFSEWTVWPSYTVKFFSGLRWESEFNICYYISDRSRNIRFYLPDPLA